MSETAKKTLADRIREDRILMLAGKIATTENQADKWQCNLRIHGDRFMVAEFTMGSGHGGRQPTVDEVLNCVLDDSAGFENAEGFEDWAGQYGYDEDSRRAEKVWDEVWRQRNRLREFLGDKYDVYLWETEREL